MRDLSIAYGNGRTAKFWSNKTIRFDELCDRLRSPIYTSETAEEYPKLPKGQRDDIKDKALLPDICVITADRQIKWCAVPCWYMTLTTLKQSFCRTLAAKFPTRAAITPPTATPRSIRGRE